MGRNKGNFEQEILEFYTSSFASFVTRVWFKIRTAQNAKCFAAVQTQPRRLNIYKSDKTFYNTLWFCIIKSLKSLQNVLKLPKITPEVPKSMHLGHIFLLRLAKTVFHHYPRLLYKPREPAHTSKGLSVAAFCTKCGKKKHISAQCA